MRRFAPDFDDEVTTEVPTFRRKAQELLHQLVGADISPEDYLEKLELVQTAFLHVYQEGTHKDPSVTTKTTVRPRKATYPGVGPEVPSVHPPALIELDLDWIKLNEE